MIKQLLSSAGNNKEAGLATNITKTAGTNSEPTSPGLFGSILKTVQEFGQQSESDTASSQQSEGEQKEVKNTDEATSTKTEVVSEEQAEVIEQEENEKELTGTEKEGEKVASTQTESKGNANAPEEDVLLTDVDKSSPVDVNNQAAETEEKNHQEPVVTHNTVKETGQPTISEAGTDVAKASNNSVNGEAANPTVDAETKIVDQAASQAGNHVSGEVKVDEPIATQPESLKVHSEEASQSPVEKGEASDTEIELSEEMGESGSDSLVQNSGNTSSVSSLPTEAGISQQKNRKVTEQATAGTAQKQRVSESPESKEVEPEAEVDITKPIMQAAAGQTASGAPEVNQGVQNQKVEEARVKKFRENYSFSGRQELTSERLEVITQSRDTKTPASFLSQPDVPVQAVLNQMSPAQNSAMTTEQELMLKEYLKESVEMAEQKDAANALFARMGEMPVSNMLIRRTVLPSLTQAVQKTVSAGKATPETWQKHSFELEDGNSIQLSTRQVDGVLQVKLATTSVELSRLMQQYEQEIKQHLEQECQLDVNLQFDGDDQGQEMSGFFGNSSSSQQKASGINTGTGNEQAAAQKTDKNLQQTVRRFGYNQMEWTA